MHTAKIVRNNAKSIAQAALRASSVYDLRELRVEQSNGTLIVFGSVSTFYHKQLAQEILLGISQGMNVINEIHVLYPPR